MKEIKKPIENIREYARWADWCNANRYEIREDEEKYYCVKVVEAPLVDVMN